MKNSCTAFTGVVALLAFGFAAPASALTIDVSGMFSNPTVSDPSLLAWYFQEINNQDNDASPSTTIPVNANAPTDSVAYFGWGFDPLESFAAWDKIQSHFWFNGTGSVGGGSPVDISLGESFSLGQFVYTNEETLYSGGYVTIDFGLNIAVNGSALDMAQYVIGIDNTPNVFAPYDDTAELLSGPMNINFTANSIEYLLTFDGFSRDGGNTFETYATLAEDAQTSAEIFATITQVTPVPLPAAAWLMLSGLGALIGFARNR